MHDSDPVAYGTLPFNIKTTQLDYKLHTDCTVPLWHITPTWYLYQQTMGKGKVQQHCLSLTTHTYKNSPQILLRTLNAKLCTDLGNLACKNESCPHPVYVNTAAARKHYISCSIVTFFSVFNIHMTSLRLLKDLRILNIWWGTQKAKNSSTHRANWKYEEHETATGVVWWSAQFSDWMKRTQGSLRGSKTVSMASWVPLSFWEALSHRQMTPKAWQQPECKGLYLCNHPVSR